MQEEASEHAQRVSGYVKWFDANRGFGFLVDDAGGADVLIHGNVLRKFGQGSVAEGTRIIVDAISADRGRQAARIVSIDTAAEVTTAPIADLCNISHDELMCLPALAARVKWFDRAKGFGFANIFGRRDDVFLHIEVVRHSGFADLEQGEAVGMRVVEGRRGLMAAQLFSWDRAGDEASVDSFVAEPLLPHVRRPDSLLGDDFDDLNLPDHWNRRASDRLSDQSHEESQVGAQVMAPFPYPQLVRR